MEAIILAGGLGTRLRSVIGESLPKCMAQVASQPFLRYLFHYLEEEGCSRAILSLGHGHAYILDWLEKNSPTKLIVDHVIESEPLGTGGGIRLAMNWATEDYVFVLNGDTFFDVRLASLLSFSANADAETTLALKPMQNFERYGTVEAEEATGRIVRFEEKRPQEKGLINGGVYCIHRERFLTRAFPEKFSFEKDYLEAVVGEGIIYGYESSGYFIDIGVPEDYERAQQDFQNRIPA